MPEHWGTPAFYIFTQADDAEAGEDATYGDELAEFITTNKLGTVVKSEAARNTNSGNLVNVFVWGVNRDAWHTFAKEKFLEVKDGKRKGK